MIRRLSRAALLGLAAATLPLAALAHAGADGAWRDMRAGDPLRLAFRAADLLVFPA